MNFNDLFFIYAFLPVILIFYYLIPNIHYKNWVLIFASFIFYGWANPVMLLFLFCYSLLNYVFGRLIGRWCGKTAGKVILICSLTLNIGFLFLFKYIHFFLQTVGSICSCSFSLPKFALPLGISFFTFRVISYLLDVYWEKVETEQSFSAFLLFVSLFPCTTAGPIVRYSTIGPSIHERKIQLDDLFAGVVRFSIGLGKKVILADLLYQLTDQYLGGDVHLLTVSESWFSLLIYTLYVYFDFSGYSDMAIGLGRLFGFRFEENFRYPFVCTSISEFWQRWHISLGSFFRDYLLYVPIFGRMRRYGGLFLVWLCTGLWHGASWNYVIWGLYFGLFIFFESLLGKKRMKKIPVIIRHIYTKLIILIGFAIFYFTDLRKLGTFLSCLLGITGNGFANEFSGNMMLQNVFLVLIAIVCTFPIGVYIKEKMSRSSVWVGISCVGMSVWALFLLLFATLLLVNATNQPFLYTQF